MKVIKDFYCTKEKKVYKVGDEYTGVRADLINNVEQRNKPKKEDKKKSINIETK